MKLKYVSMMLAAAQNGLTIEQVAKASGMSRTTFYSRLNSGNWTIKEAIAVGNVIGITDLAKLIDFFYKGNPKNDTARIKSENNPCGNSGKNLGDISTKD